MVLDEKVQRAGEQLLERIRQQTEQAVFGFVRELLTTAAKEQATALQEDRRVADSARQTALQEEGARVRAEVEKTWAAKLSEANDAADQRFALELRTAREEADRQLAQKVASVRDEAQKVLDAALEAARQEAARALVLRVDEVREEAEGTIAAELAAAPVASAPEPTPAEPQTDEILGRLLDGVRRLDQASRLTDVLDTLAELAGNAAPRAAVLTVLGDRVRGWRFVGFGPTLGDDAALPVDLASGEAGIVGRAALTGEVSAVVSGPNGDPENAEPAFTTLSVGVHALAVPVIVGGQVMAVVYGDDAERRPAAAWCESLEVLARHAGHCLGALTAVRAAQLAVQGVESIIADEARPLPPLDDARDQARE